MDYSVGNNPPLQGSDMALEVPNSRHQTGRDEAAIALEPAASRDLETMWQRLEEQDVRLKKQVFFFPWRATLPHKKHKNIKAQKHNTKQEEAHHCREKMWIEALKQASSAANRWPGWTGLALGRQFVSALR